MAKKPKASEAVEDTIDTAANEVADTANKLNEALAPKTGPDAIPHVTVRTRKAASRRRAGFEFSREPRTFAAGDLADAQIMALVDDGELIVAIEPAQAA